MVKLLRDEPGTDEMLYAWRDAEEISCISIGYVEARAAIARRFAARAAERARRLLDEYWQQVQTIAVDDLLVGLAARIADTRRLRALDALHLAAASQVASHELVLATWDRELAIAAGAAGFATLP